MTIFILFIIKMWGQEKIISRINYHITPFYCYLKNFTNPTYVSIFRRKIMFIKKLGKIATILFVMMLVTSTVLAASSNSNWLSPWIWSSNTRYQADTSIKSSNVANLKVKWQFTTAGDVSATPSVDDNNVYSPDWGGYLDAVNKDKGTLVWKHKVSDYTGLVGIPPTTLHRRSPAIHPPLMAISSFLEIKLAIMAARKVMWWQLIRKPALWIGRHRSGRYSRSRDFLPAVIYKGTVYIGIASAEEAYEALIPGYPCCSFRSAMFALDFENRRHQVADLYGP